MASALQESGWSWFCGASNTDNSNNTDVLNTGKTVHSESCLPNLLLFSTHLTFVFVFLIIVLCVVIQRKLYRQSRQILIRYPGHECRWILNTIYLVVLLISIGESILSDSKLTGPTQPHLYMPAIFALLAAIVTACLYHVIELTKKSRLVFSLTVYWILVLVLEAFRLSIWITSDSTKADLTVIRFDIIVIFVVLYGLYIALDIVVIIKKVFRCHTPYDPASTSEDRVQKDMHYHHYNVSLFSASTFSWINWLFTLGYKRPLEMEDLGCLPQKLTSEFGRRNFSSALKHEQKRAAGTNSPLSLYRVYYQLCSKTLLYAGILRFCGDTLSFVGPIAINGLVFYATSLQDKDYDYFPDKYTDYVTVSEFVSNGFVLIFIIFVTSWLRLFCLQNHYHLLIVQGLSLRASLQTAVYDKSLRLSSYTLSGGEMTVGAIINHMSTDPENLVYMLEYIHYIWCIPYQIIGTILLLYYNLSSAALAGFSIFVLLIPLQVCIASILAKLQKKTLGLSDIRLKRSNEILQGIRMVKVQALEDVFFKYIDVIRRKEIWLMVKAATLVGVLYFTQNACPILVSLLSFTLYSIITGSVLTPNIAFSTLALINQITIPITIIPLVVSCFVSGHISTQRIRKFLLATEIDLVNSGRSPDNDDDDDDLVTETALDTGQPCLEISSGRFTWDPKSSEPILDNINMQIPAGKLIMIVGKVGSGKSSLISAFLGEMTKQNGDIMWNNHISPKVAYCPQKAWLLNRSLEKNITFSKDKDDQIYKEVIESCALQPDIDILPDKDQSMIGEKGINLSGGQKQRVSMARAIYSGCQVVIMDDPLSALDVHVGRHVFQEAIMGQLVKEGKTVIIVTHQLQYLQYADQVMVIKSGAISCQGTPDEVAASDPDLAKTWTEALEHIEHGSEDEDEEHTVEEERRHLAELCSSNPDLRHGKHDGLGDKGDADSSVANQGGMSWKEERLVGKVSMAVYYWYGQMMRWPVVFFVLLAMLVQSGLSVGTNFWLSAWSSVGLNSTNASNPEVKEMTQYYINGYISFAMSSISMALVSAILINIGSLVASKKMHEDMLENVLHMPIRFFENTPVGRIVNRFSADMNTLDRRLGETLMWMMTSILNCISSVIVNAVITPVFLLVVLPVAIGFVILQQFFIRTTIELKRLDSIAKSPIYALFGETLNGLPTVRSYRCQSKFRKELYERIDNSVLANLYLQTANRWLGVRLDTLGALFVLTSGLTALTVATIGELDPGYVGLAVTYALSSNMWLNWLVRNTADAEIQMNAAERIRWFVRAQREQYYGKEEPPADWPSSGKVSYDTVDCRYGDDLPLILRDVSMEITGHEKIGIVGRTGSGKTSLVTLLFRLVEHCKGVISIDGIHIDAIGLKQLRRELAIIPQDPILFSGNVRFNLDPRSRKSDEEIWSALEMAHMKEFLKSNEGLDFEVSEGGENLSVGQRQLMCLARAFLQDTKVVVMDEATSSIDLQTDAFLQKSVHTIFKEKTVLTIADAFLQKSVHTIFKEKTVLTIAHRVSTVRDYDRILVLENGQIKEFDSPENLMTNPNSTFYQMVKAGK